MLYCCVPEHGVSLIIVSLHTEFLVCPWTRIVSYYCVPDKDFLLLFCPWIRSFSCCVPEHGLCLIIVSLNTACLLLLCPWIGVFLINVPLNTGCLLLCPWIRNVSYYCVLEYGASLTTLSLNTECYYCAPEHEVSLNVSLNMECLLLLCPWTRSISYYFVPEDGKLTYTYPASSGTSHDSNCLA